MRFCDIFLRQNKHDIMFRSDTMSPRWKTNLRRSSQRFEPPYVRSTSVFSCNPILHFSSSLSYVYIDSSTAFSPRSGECCRKFCHRFASPSVRHIPKKTVRPRRLISATQLGYRAMTTKTATPCRETKYPENTGNLSELLRHQTNARSLLLPFLLANERRASGR